MVVVAIKDQMKVEFSYFGEAWNFFKKYYEVSAEDEYWASVFEDASFITQKYQCELCKDLIIAIINELDRKGKGLPSKE